MSQYCVYAIKPYNHSQPVVWYASPVEKPLQTSTSLEKILPPGPMVFEADSARDAINEYQGHLNVDRFLDVKQPMEVQKKIVFNSMVIQVDEASEPVELQVGVSTKAVPPKTQRKAVVYSPHLGSNQPKKKRRRLKKKRISWGKEKGEYGKSLHGMFSKGSICPSCGCEWGKLHNSDGYYICDIEQCPYCKKQLLFCGHAMKVFRNLKRGCLK